jgi:hypothetical protein
MRVSECVPAVSRSYGFEQSHAFQQVQGFIQLIIVLGQIRCFGAGGWGIGQSDWRRFDFVGAVVAQVAGQVGFLDEIRIGAVIGADS